MSRSPPCAVGGISSSPSPGRRGRGRSLIRCFRGSGTGTTTVPTILNSFTRSTRRSSSPWGSISRKRRFRSATLGLTYGIRMSELGLPRPTVRTRSDSPPGSTGSKRALESRFSSTSLDLTPKMSTRMITPSSNQVMPLIRVRGDFTPTLAAGLRKRKERSGCGMITFATIKRG